MRIRIGLLVLLAALVMVIPGAAQENGASPDEVNEVAEKMYCPVCENIPLDDCGTAACQDWREEIRLMLNDGMNEDQIINDFIVRFGDRVVGTPRDPALRAMSLVTPWVLAAIALFAAIWTITRKTRTPDEDGPSITATDSADDLRAQLERDLQG